MTRTRIYLETMSAVLPAAGKKLIFDEKAKGILPLFPLGAAGGSRRPSRRRRRRHDHARRWSSAARCC